MSPVIKDDQLNCPVTFCEKNCQTAVQLSHSQVGKKNLPHKILFYKY